MAALYADIAGCLGTDPATDEAQALADRWLRLSIKSAAGVPEAQTDSMTAWMNREQWPPVMKQRLAQFQLEDVTEFIKHAVIAAPKSYFSEQAWASYRALKSRPLEERSRAWQAKVDLFRDVAKTLNSHHARDDSFPLRPGGAQ